MKIYRGLKSVCTAMETNPLIFSPIYCKLQTMTQFLIYVAAVLQWSGLQIMLQIVFTLSLCTLQPDRVKLAQINHLPVESRQGNEAF